MLLQVCLVTDRRSHLNVVRTSVTHFPTASCHFFVLTVFCCHPWSPGIIEGTHGNMECTVFVKICWNSAATVCLTYKVAAHNLCALLLMRFSMHTGIKKNVLIQQSFYLVNDSTFWTECIHGFSLCKKFMLEKETMQEPCNSQMFLFFLKEPSKMQCMHSK